MRCAICDEDRDDPRSFSFHIRTHGVSSSEYTWKHVLGIDRHPTCAEGGCDNPVRYVAFTFKKFCRDHSYLAESEAGKVGGKKKKTWNRGKTATEDSRIPVLRGESNHFFGRKHSPETRSKISSSLRVPVLEVMKRISGSRNLELVSGLDGYLSRQNQYLILRCLLCGREWEKTLQAVERGSACRECYPTTSSLSELELGDVIESWGFKVRRNVRDVIAPKELDIYVPEKRLAIEYNGLYWHSRKDGGKDQHVEKTDMCEKLGIQLVHIFSDEWRDKRDVCESMIKHRLGITKRKIFARNCVVRDVSLRDSKGFLEKTHLAGFVRSFFSRGLYHEDELVALLSVREPMQRSAYPGLLEVARFSTALDTSVVGALGKLIKHIVKNDLPPLGKSGLMTYVDRKIGKGSGYSRAGMKFFGKTLPGYWYTDGVSRFDRFRFRSRDGISEKEIAIREGVERVYGCGNNIYTIHCT